MATVQDELVAESSGGVLRRILIWLGVLVGLVLLYYVGGAIWVHKIDDDPAFDSPVTVPENASQTVAVLADLIDREVNQNRWVANDPPFQPAWLLDNMPAYQTGMMTAVGRFTTELRDRIARVRGSSAADPDLERAAGKINFPGDQWAFQANWPFVQAASEGQYRQGMEDLRRYNERLAQGQAVFERRADNLLATLDRISDDIGSASAALTLEVDQGATSFLDFNADNLFYSVKGKLYAYYLILRELGHDYADVIRERNLQASWDDLLNSARIGATLHPWMVSNGPLDSQAVPNHLAGEAFLLLRVRTKLEEIIDILQT
jgi:hypothetical protein